MCILHIFTKGLVMRFITLIIALIVTTSTVEAQECRAPSKHNAAKKVSEYRIRQGDTICLSSGSKLVARRVNKGSVTFGVKGIKGESSKRLDSKSARIAKVSSYRLKLKNLKNRAASAIVTVEVAELDIKVFGPFPGPAAPRVCAQMEGVCTTLYAPVCGIDLQGEFREYSNACQAAADCAEVVEDTLC